MNILIINAHPDAQSYCAELAKAYLKGATSTHDCELINLTDLAFDPILHHGYRVKMELEPDLKTIQHKIANANHLVFVYPTWWGTYPALLKGFIDRVFLPGFGFKYRENSILWDKLLHGKTARLIITMDTPRWYYNLFYRKPGVNSIKKCVLQFCGINPVRVTCFGPIKTSSFEQRQKWLKKVEVLGEKGA